ncbi:sugar ABC transporter permease [Candidatus Flexifilum breve]|uniref:sugar ABC transporter permease n=1 Tax=Candidatus Flexifilum breve TaxID=3140694 RepID=UPI0031CC5F82
MRNFSELGIKPITMSADSIPDLIYWLHNTEVLSQDPNFDVRINTGETTFSEGYLDALTTWKTQLVDTGYISQDTVGLTDDQRFTEFGTGTAAGRSSSGRSRLKNSCSSSTSSRPNSRPAAAKLNSWVSLKVNRLIDTLQVRRFIPKADVHYQQSGQENMMTEKGIRLSLSQGFARRASRRSAKDFFKGNLTYILFVLPAFTIYTILTIIPLVNTVVYSFTNFNGLSPNYEFVGIDNYLRAFSTRNAATAFGNSITYALVVPILITLLALPLALLLDSQMKTRNIQRAIFFFPSVISSLFLGFIWNFILSPSNQGLINSLLLSAGQQKLLLLADPRAAMVLLILVSVWASTGGMPAFTSPICK